MVDYFTRNLQRQMRSIALDNWWDSLKYINLLCQKEKKKSVSPKRCLPRFSSVFFLTEGMTLTASVVVKLLLQFNSLKSSSPWKHIKRRYELLKRAAMWSKWIHKWEIFPPHSISVSLPLFPQWFFFMRAEQSDRFHIDWQREIFRLLL